MKRPIAQERRTFMEVTVAEDIRSQVHKWLRTLAERSTTADEAHQAGFHRLDSTFGCELANAAQLSLPEVLVGARLLRRYRQQVEAPGVALPDEVTIIGWATEQDEIISEEEHAMILELSRQPEPAPVAEQPESP